jgi:hypothetical protein
MKQASFASLIVLGFLATPALAEAQTKAPDAAPKAAPETPKPADTGKPSDAPKADTAAPATDSAAAPDAASETLPEALPTPAAPAAAPGTPSGGFNPLPAWPEPGNDAAELKRQNAERPHDATGATDEHEVFAEDWWAHARPLLELHGNFRVRAELFYQFSLGRRDPPATALWPQPADNYFTDTTNAPHGPQTCTQAESNNGTDTTPTNAT